MSREAAALRKVIESVEILLEHAGPMAVPASEAEVAIANRALDDAQALLTEDGA